MADAREIALLAVQRAHSDLERNARAVPAHLHQWLPGGHARTLVQIVAHCGVWNHFLAAVIGRLPLPYRTKDEEDAAIAACETLEAALALLNTGTAAVQESIRGVNDAFLASTVTMPWGERLPAAIGLLLPAQHMHYHDGQISLMQLLTGDDDYH